MTVVPSTGGVVLPLSTATFKRQPGSILPTIVIERPPLNADASVVGQFVYIVPHVGAPARDSLKYRLTQSGQQAEQEMELNYANACFTQEPDEALFYLPAGRYFVPAASPDFPLDSRNEVVKLLIAPGSPAFQSDIDQILEAVHLDKPVCIQTMEQSATASVSSHMRIRASCRFPRLGREDEERSAHPLESAAMD